MTQMPVALQPARTGPAARILLKACLIGKTGAGRKTPSGEEVLLDGKRGAAGKREDVGWALIRMGLAWQDQRRPSSARLRSLEQEARREEVNRFITTAVNLSRSRGCEASGSLQFYRTERS
ncbi:hypothetical protein [Salinibacter ruber]|uniref:hypothetical protein n=1 Tax=Salinibacter ruber TaxID=146919 RepID=UPI00216A811A|nr:hypothetical protein [Salinibacter ruber]MCS3613409.1 hypothetical protein [Salinibacter ruber]